MLSRQPWSAIPKWRPGVASQRAGSGRLPVVIAVRIRTDRDVVVAGVKPWRGRHMPRHHFVEEPTKKTHGVGNVVRSPRREAQEFGQDVADPWGIAGQVDLALRRARLERPAPRRLVGHRDELLGMAVDPALVAALIDEGT